MGVISRLVGSTEEREYRVVSYLVTSIATLCCASPDRIIDKLTGYCWDEEEAGIIKNINVVSDEDN